MPTTLEPDSGEVISSVEAAAIVARHVDADEFRRLLVSNRRMERADRIAPKMRGLRDLETGELYLTDERWLIDGKR